MYNYIQRVRSAACDRQDMTLRCKLDYFRRFGACMKLKRGDFDTELPQIRDALDNCTFEELIALKEATKNLCDALSEWSFVCKSSLDIEASLPQNEWGDFLNHISRKISEVDNSENGTEPIVQHFNFNAPVGQVIAHVDNVVYNNQNMLKNDIG